MAIGLVVDRVSDILTIPIASLLPVPNMNAGAATDYSNGIIVQPAGMICFLNLQRMFESLDTERLIAA
jgi:purine-binding chemotaxis protein CheW